MSLYYIRHRPIFDGEVSETSYIMVVEAPDALAAQVKAAEGDNPPRLVHDLELVTQEEWEAECARIPHTYLVTFPLVTDEPGEYVMALHSVMFAPEDDNEAYAKAHAIGEIEDDGANTEPMDYPAVNTDPAVVTCRKISERELQLLARRPDCSLG